MMTAGAPRCRRDAKWKMLNEQCPVSGLVPLMEHRRRGEVTVVAQKYLDEIKPVVVVMGRRWT